MSRLSRWLSSLALIFVLMTALPVAALRWFDPPLSAFMLRQLVLDWMDGEDEVFVYHDWVPWDAISPHIALAVVAAEDQRFPLHWGFDLVEIERALDDYRNGGRLRGASTISQQLAKNLFLWPGQNLVRKGLEAWFTVWIELLLPKRRILELYLNLAEFGPETFGVGVASRRYFNKQAAAVSAREASLMAAVLPNPSIYRLAEPSGQVRKRAAWIRGQARNLGAGYLDGL